MPAAKFPAFPPIRFGIAYLFTERMSPLKDWISLFEKYRIDRRMYELYCHEYISLHQSSPRKAALEADMTRLERSICCAEILLSHYDSVVTSPRDALQRAEERLYLAFHYVNGLPIESTANAMGVSRDTAYRIRRRIMARGEIPKEFFEICQKYLLTESESPNASTAPLSSRKQTEHPGFLFTAK